MRLPDENSFKVVDASDAPASWQATRCVVLGRRFGTGEYVRVTGRRAGT